MFWEVGHEREGSVIVDSVHHDEPVHIHQRITGLEVVSEWLSAELTDLRRGNSTKDFPANTTTNPSPW